MFIGQNEKKTSWDRGLAIFSIIELNVVSESWRADNSSSDCFVFVLMTHGMPGNFYCGTDSQVHINDLLSDFKNGSCPDPLHGKPKLFFLQVSGSSSFVSKFEAEFVQLTHIHAF